MKAWIFSIVGIVIVMILLDLMMEEGETKKYIKGIIALFAVIVIASPIPNILRGDFKADIGLGDTQIEVDTNYLKDLNARRLNANISLTEQRLTANGIVGAKIEAIPDLSTTDYRLIKVVVKVKKSVITDETANINKTEMIIKIVANGLRTEKEVVSVYVEEDNG